MSEFDPLLMFTADGTAAMPDVPAIVGGHCKNCNAVFFPFQHFGCENCGSTQIEQSRFDGQGTVLTTARVHLHADPNRPAPFTIAAVLLDCGAFLRALMNEQGAEDLKIGDTVVTMLVPEIRPGRAAMDLRFKKKAAT